MYLFYEFENDEQFKAFIAYFYSYSSNNNNNYDNELCLTRVILNSISTNKHQGRNGKVKYFLYSSLVVCSVWNNIFFHYTLTILFTILESNALDYGAMHSKLLQDAGDKASLV